MQIFFFSFLMLLKNKLFYIEPLEVPYRIFKQLILKQFYSDEPTCVCSLNTHDLINNFICLTSKIVLPLKGIGKQQQ